MQRITVTAAVNANMEKVWEYWTEPKHIVMWNFASDDWEAPSAKNDIKVGGKFCFSMAAKDRSAQFDFTGTYTHIKKHELIEYTITGGRQVKIKFTKLTVGTKITETFDAEDENSADMQRAGWQAILDNFKKYTENH